MGGALLSWPLVITTTLLCCQLCIPELEFTVSACAGARSGAHHHTLLAQFDTWTIATQTHIMQPYRDKLTNVAHLSGRLDRAICKEQQVVLGPLPELVLYFRQLSLKSTLPRTAAFQLPLRRHPCSALSCQLQARSFRCQPSLHAKSMQASRAY